MTTYIIRDAELKNRDIDKVRYLAHDISRTYKKAVFIYRCTLIIKIEKYNEIELNPINYEDLYSQLVIKIDERETQIARLKSDIKKLKDELNISNSLSYKKTGVIKFLKHKLCYGNN